jgi:maleylacetate reductase
VRFVHDQAAARLVFGAPAVDAIPGELERLGVRRCLVVHGGSVAATAEALRDRLGDRWAGAWSEVRRHVPVEVAERARARAREAGADGLVAIGGGSPIGVAKAVALTAGLPIVAVPTTYSGSEMTALYGVTEGGRKRTGRDEAVRPRTVIYDPRLSRDLPVATSAASAMNALAHCVDALWAPGANPLTELTAVEGSSALRAGLEGILTAPGDLEARGRLLYGAALAGWTLAVAGTSLHHRLCHVLGGALDLPHAETHAVILPHAAALCAPAAPAAAERVARVLGGEEIGAAVRALAVRAGVPTSLRELGVRETELDVALAEIGAAAPLPVTEDDLRGLLRRAWSG